MATCINKDPHPDHNQFAFLGRVLGVLWVLVEFWVFFLEENNVGSWGSWGSWGKILGVLREVLGGSWEEKKL